jgi:hypothetical protein
MFMQTFMSKEKKLSRTPILFGASMLLVIIAPNILQPSWLWRLIALLVCGLLLVILCIWALFSYQASANELTNMPPRPKAILWVTYIGVCLCLLAALYVIVVPAAIDSYYLLVDQTNGLDSAIITFSDMRHGGSVDPWFMVQRLYTTDGKEYTLPFSFRAFGPGVYNVLYSPRTDIIYEMSPAEK